MGSGERKIGTEGLESADLEGFEYAGADGIGVVLS